ncbi:hypothetical protein R1sor_003763 [Riccia sorocarpa]|uniref:C2 domain-containing protein n=1 Tax=Riccia sorocarpa TaxID=122646 RepID=A0ABD3H4Q3_9MARC
MVAKEESPDWQLGSQTRPMMKAGELIIRLKQADHLKGKSFLWFGRASMYALFTIGGEKRNSKVIHHSGTSPVWNEQLSFKIAEHVHFGLYNTLNVHFFDHELRRRNIPRGTAKIDVAALLEEHKNEVPVQEYQVFYKGKPKGTVELGLTFIPSTRKPLNWLQNLVKSLALNDSSNFAQR